MKLLEPTFPVFKPNLNPYIPQNKIESLREFSECIFLPFSRGLQNAKKRNCNNVISTHHHLFYKQEKRFSCGLTNCLQT